MILHFTQLKARRMILTVLICFLPLALVFRGLRHWAYAGHVAVLAAISWWRFPSLEYTLFHLYYLYFLGGWHLAGINLITFATYGWDKRCARYGGWRVPEKTLHALAFIGGTLGAYLGSKYFRHKTIKGSFRQTFIGVVLLQIFLTGAVLWYWLAP